MRSYRLQPVRHVGVQLVPCPESERELWGIYCSDGVAQDIWIADYSPHAKELAEDFLAWLANREAMQQALDIVDPPAANDQ